MQLWSQAEAMVTKSSRVGAVVSKSSTAGAGGYIVIKESSKAGGGATLS